MSDRIGNALNMMFWLKDHGGPEQDAIERIRELEAQVTRLQALIQRWAQEDLPDGQVPDLASLEFTQGLRDGDMRPVKGSNDAE